MLEMKINDKGTHVVVSGVTLTELLSELGEGINSIYTQLNRANPDCAKQFREALTMALVLPGSPIWNPTRRGSGVAMVIPNP